MDMVQHERSNSGSVTWRRWHEERQLARETAMSEDEFGPVETEQFDLDTAQITGESNPESYRLEPYGADQDPVDYRETDPRFD